MNLIANPTPESLAGHGLRWEPAPLSWEALPAGGLRVKAPGRSDYFQDPGGEVQKNDAPFLWLLISGDFVAQAHVQPTFSNTWDAGALLAYQDETHWAKLCFEATDLGTTAAVSVITNGFSDDANGADLTTPALWLQLYRAGPVIGLHYALDGHNWRMVRLCRLPLADPLRLGLVAQCPAGPGATVDWLHFSVEKRRVENLRAGR
jgi:regulation of enolase protein 1 (concanavalin A-like superfamily)